MLMNLYCFYLEYCRFRGKKNSDRIFSPVFLMKVFLIKNVYAVYHPVCFNDMRQEPYRSECRSQISSILNGVFVFKL